MSDLPAFKDFEEKIERFLLFPLESLNQSSPVKDVIGTPKLILQMLERPPTATQTTMPCF